MDVRRLLRSAGCSGFWFYGVSQTHKTQPLAKATVSVILRSSIFLWVGVGVGARTVPTMQVPPENFPGAGIYILSKQPPVQGSALNLKGAACPARPLPALLAPPVGRGRGRAWEQLDAPAPARGTERLGTVSSGGLGQCPNKDSLTVSVSFFKLRTDSEKFRSSG